MEYFKFPACEEASQLLTVAIFYLFAWFVVRIVFF